MEFFGHRGKAPGHDEYDAFISYSHDATKVAAAVERELLRAGRRVKAPVRIFRDETGLALGELSDSLKDAIARSKNLVLVASAGAADSKWVDAEVSHWVGLGRAPSSIRLVKGQSDLDLSWADGGFVRPDHLPESLRTSIDEEPLYADLSALRGRIRPKCRDRIAVAKLAASVVPGTTPGEVLRREDKVTKAARLAICLVIALIVGLVAMVEKNRQSAVESSRQASQSRATLEDDNRAVNLMLGQRTSDVEDLQGALEAAKSNPSELIVDSLRVALGRAAIYRKYPLPEKMAGLEIEPIARTGSQLHLLASAESEDPTSEIQLDFGSGEVSETPWVSPFEASDYLSGLTPNDAKKWKRCVDSLSVGGSIPSLSFGADQPPVVDSSFGNSGTLRSDCSTNSLAGQAGRKWLGRIADEDFFADTGVIASSTGTTFSRPIEANLGAYSRFPSSDGTIVAIQPLAAGQNLESSTISVIDLRSMEVQTFENPGARLLELSPSGTTFSMVSDTGTHFVDVASALEVLTLDRSHRNAKFISDQQVAAVGDGVVEVGLLPKPELVSNPEATCSSADAIGVADAPNARSATGDSFDVRLSYDDPSGTIDFYGEQFQCAGYTKDGYMVAVGRQGHIGASALRVGQPSDGQFDSKWEQLGVWAASPDVARESVWFIDESGKVGSISAPWTSPRPRFLAKPAAWISAGNDVVALARFGGINDWNETEWPPSVSIYTRSGLEIATHRVWLGERVLEPKVAYRPCIAVAVQGDGRVVAYDSGCNRIGREGELTKYSDPAGVPCRWCGDLAELKAKASDFLRSAPPTD